MASARSASFGTKWSTWRSRWRQSRLPQLSQPKAAAPTALHAAPALGGLTSTNMAPLLQRGIDQFLAKDQRVGEANVVFARDLLGAFAALVTQGVAEFNGEQNNGPSSVPAVGEGQDAPTRADVAAASLDGF